MEETQTTTEAKEPFIINSRERVDWYLRKLANLEAEELRIKAQAEKMLRQVQSDRESLVQHFQPQVENFVREELEATKSKRRSIAFFHGTVGFVAVPPRLVVESEADALQTARLVCPEAIVEVPATEKLDKKVLGEYAKWQLAEAGEIIPGYGLTEGGVRLSVKFPAADGAQEGGEE
jgi:hypothetical protein